MASKDDRANQSKTPTAREVAQIVVQEMNKPGWMLSFWHGDDIGVTTEQALLILANAVLEGNHDA